MHFNTLITTVLSASVAVTGVVGSDISERATQSTAADVATLESIVTDSTAFCTFWQTEYRTRTPFKELSVSQVNSACHSIVPATTPITTCVKSDLALLKAAFTEPQVFCNFYSAIPRLLSPFTNLDAVSLMAVCKYCLPHTSSTLSSTVKASSTSIKSSSKISKSNSATTSSKSSNLHTSSVSYKSAFASSKSSSTKSSSILPKSSTSTFVPRSSYSSASVSKSSSKSSSESSSTKASSSYSVSRSLSSFISSSASSSASSSGSSSASAPSSGSSSISVANAAPTASALGYLYAFDSGTAADGTALEGFTNGATDVGFELTNSGYAPLAYRLDSAGHLYLGSSGVLLSGSTAAQSTEKLGALVNGTSDWTPVTCAIDNSTSVLSCSYSNTYGQKFNSFQLYTGTSNGANAYYLQMGTASSTADITIKALASYTASSVSTSSSVAATTSVASSSPSSVTATSSTAAPEFTASCAAAPTGVFNIYASYSSPDPGAVGKPLRNTGYNYAAFYLTDTDTYPPLEFAFEADTGYLSVVSDDETVKYLVASTAALVETGVAVLPLSSNSFTPINCAFNTNCSLACQYETAYPMNYTGAQNFNVLDLQYNTDNANDYYNLEMNQYGLPIGVTLTALFVDEDSDDEQSV